jgi:Flp pilus assembly pilin Flp
VFLGTILLGIIAIVLVLTMAQSSGARPGRWPSAAAAVAPAALLPVRSMGAGLP